MKAVNYNEYIDKVREEFPDVDEASIKRIVKHGLFMIAALRKHDQDILINNNHDKSYYYFGEIGNTDAKRMEICNKKLRKKKRLLYKLNKTEYSGRYYFGLTDEDYSLFQAGEPISVVYLYRILDEAKISRRCSHFFEVEMEDPIKWVIKKENYVQADCTKHI